MSILSPAKGEIVGTHEISSINHDDYIVQYQEKQCKSENIFQDFQKTKNMLEYQDQNQNQTYSTGAKRQLFQSKSDIINRRTRKIKNHGRKADQCISILPVLQEHSEIQNIQGDSGNFIAGNNGFRDISQISAINNYNQFDDQQNEDSIHQHSSSLFNIRSNTELFNNIENLDTNSLIRDCKEFVTPIQSPKRLIFDTPQSTSQFNSKILRNSQQITSYLQILSEEDFQPKARNQNGLCAQIQQFNNKSTSSDGDSLRRNSRGSCEEVSSDFSNNIDCIIDALENIDTDDIQTQKTHNQSIQSEKQQPFQEKSKEIVQNNVQGRFIAGGFRDQMWNEKCQAQFFSGINY